VSGPTADRCPPCREGEHLHCADEDSCPCACNPTPADRAAAAGDELCIDCSAGVYVDGLCSNCGIAKTLADALLRRDAARFNAVGAQLDEEPVHGLPPVPDVEKAVIVAVCVFLAALVAAVAWVSGR
jgi:hypothetical protein